MNLSPHSLKLAVIRPQIAPNTGNIARLCVATGTPLHLVRPMGFLLSDHQLKRSAMDYWPRVKLTLHDDQDDFFRTVGEARFWLFDSGGEADLWNTRFRSGDWLIFGSETSGIDPALVDVHHERVVRIPQVQGERCLNLATAVGIALYEALRQVARSGIYHDNPEQR